MRDGTPLHGNVFVLMGRIDAVFCLLPSPPSSPPLSAKEASVNTTKGERDRERETDRQGKRQTESSECRSSETKWLTQPKAYRVERNSGRGNAKGEGERGKREGGEKAAVRSNRRRRESNNGEKRIHDMREKEVEAILALHHGLEPRTRTHTRTHTRRQTKTKTKTNTDREREKE